MIKEEITGKTEEKATEEKEIIEKTEEKEIIEKTEEKEIIEKTEEKATEEKEIIEKTEDQEDVIDGYIDHIRNTSKLANDEIGSIIIDIIEKDVEFLEILRKFLEDSEKMSELVNDKIESAEEEEGGDKAEKKEKIDDILEAFDDSDYAYPLEDIMKSLRDTGRENPGTIILDAINDKILYVDDIDEDETMYLALTKEGASLWESRYI